MRLGFAALAVALLGGCSAQISDARETQIGGGVDGGVAPEPDAGRGPPISPDAAPVALCTSRTVYLNFDGQTLTRGASDATQNQASWMTKQTGTAPPYLDGNADRDAAIQSIVDGVRTQLSKFPIAVTTTRPATGDYVMIVFGGNRNSVGSQFGSAVNALDCGDTRPDDVAWISDGVAPTQHVVNTAIGAIGFGLGLTATTDPKDCMCGWANNCSSDDNDPCTLGSPIARDPTADQLCPNTTSQDEVAAFRTAFCH